MEATGRSLIHRRPSGWRGLTIVAFLGVLFLLVGGGVLGALLLRGDADDEPSPELLESHFEFTAVEADDIGIEPDTAFILTADDDIDSRFVRAFLHVEPTVDLEIARRAPRSHLITPAQPLEPGRVYRFSLAEASGAPHVLASWAFQTKSPISVVQTLPRHQATDVPVNTGIELTFSHDNVRDVASHFEIEPHVEGRFEVHKRVVVFAPEELAPDTLYTITLRAGVAVRGTNDVMADDVVFQFETGDTERTGLLAFKPTVAFTRPVNEASTLEAPALQMYTSSFEADLARKLGETDAADPEEEALAFEVYRYPDLTAFLAELEAFQEIPSWATLTRESYLSPTDGLELTASFETSLQQLDDYGDRFVTFPEPLPEGFYLVRTRFEGRRVQSWLQVTDVATYLAVGRESTLTWVNDLATKEPLVAAQVEYLDTGVKAATDDEGVALLDTPEIALDEEPNGYGYVRIETSGSLLVTAPDGRRAVVPLGVTGTGFYHRSYYGYGHANVGDEYWHYISTDRPLYLPSDTIRFWGVARPREEPAPSETLMLELTGYSYFDYYYRPVVIAETEVLTTPLGTFSGELSFQSLSPGYYELTVKAGGQRIDSIGIPVETYTRPAYKIDVVPDRLAVISGEKVSYSVDASFLEGSPVPGLQLRCSGAGSGEFITDESGHASVQVTAGWKEEYGPGTNYLSVTPLLAEEAEITGEAFVSVHPSSLTISGSSQLEGEEGIIEGAVHHVDLSRINEGTASGYDDYLGAPATDMPVSIAIREVSWERREIGQYYDFIAKVVRKRYDYTRIEVPLGTFTAATDAEGGFRHTFRAEPEKHYEIDIAVTDEAGRRAERSLFLSGRGSYFNARSGLVYLAPQGSPNTYYGGTEEYAIGDEVVLEMHRGADLLPSGNKNRYLFYQAQNGIRGYGIQDDPTLRFAFGQENVPSTTVQGVWFNGRTYQETAYGYRLRFDSSERELSIELAPDQERYEPGDSVHLDVLVTDGQGRPQPDTEVNLAVVDEAIFLIQGSQRYAEDLLHALYRSVGAGILRTYASHQYPNENQAAEKGGDGGVRRDFADVAFFGEVTTDGDGRASVSFDLPDNLTSWRVTAQAFNDDLMAGTALRKIPVGLPFFVQATLNEEYLVSDRPVIAVRSYGRALDAAQEVAFTVTAPTLGLTEPVRVTAAAFEAARVLLPDLREGRHELLIEGSAGDMQDALVRIIRVVPSRLVKGEARFYELEDGLQVEGSADRPTMLVFSDHERGRYFPALQRLVWGYGDRVDQMLARDLAAELLESYFEELEARGEQFDASLYQTPDGGVALFPYADDDLALTARVVALAPERFGRNSLAGYFLAVTESRSERRERQLIALYGLAALDEPVLVPLQALLDESDLTWRERLYLGLAAQELGDDTIAGAIYRGLIDDYGESRAPYYRLRVGVDHDDILEATSLAAILGAGLGDDLAPRLFDYTANNRTKDLLVELEQISYLANALPRLSAEPVRFAYTLDGRRQETKLDPYRAFSLQVTPQQLESLRFEAVEGRVGIASFFTAPLDPAELAPDPDISVTRSYGGAGEEPVVLQEGELVRIILSAEFGPQAIDGCYQVSDLLPSGLKAVTRPRSWDLAPPISSPYRIEGQRVSFCVSDHTASRGALYYARVVTAGKYTAEPAVIQSMKSRESSNLSAPLQVEIR